MITQKIEFGGEKQTKQFLLKILIIYKSEIANYLSGKEIYVRDGYVCADPEYKTNVRTVTEYPWSNMFVYNMFLRPDESELENFKEEWLVLCAPGYECPEPC